MSKFKGFKKLFTFLLFFLLGFPFSVKALKDITGAGATFPYPIYSKWAYEYEKERGVKVNYQSIGSGGGIRQIKERTVHFGASDLPLKPEEVEKNNLLQFPTVIGGVVLAVNIPELSNQRLVLDGESLCKIYLGEIKTWDNPKLKSLNPNLNLPSKPIIPVYRSDGSGTTSIFTHYLSQVCERWAKEIGYGTSVAWKTGIGAKGNEGIANYIKRTPYSIGYVEYAYAIQNKLVTTDLINAKGKRVTPDEETFKAAAKGTDFDLQKHFYAWMTNSPHEKAWPITGATYILLAREKTNINQEVVKFFAWAYQKGDQMASSLDYVPLPKEVKNKIINYWKNYKIY